MKVLELSRGIAGGYAGAMLAIAGADVMRWVLPRDPAVDDVAAAWLDRGKTVIERPPEPAAAFAAVDAVVEDLGPGGLDALGLPERRLREGSPSLVLARISDFGQDGPKSGWRGSEIVNLAAGGLLFLTGSWEAPPVQLAPYQAQLQAGVITAGVTLAALFAREPVTLDLSKQEIVAGLVTPALTDYAYSGAIAARDGKASNMARIERSKDGWVYVGPGAAANADYATYAAFLGIPEFAEERFSTADGRLANWDEHQRLLRPKIREKTSAEWTEEAQAWRLTFGLTQTTAELLDCPQLNGRGYFGPIDTPVGTGRAPLAPYLENGRRPVPPAAAGANDD